VAAEPQAGGASRLAALGRNVGQMCANGCHNEGLPGVVFLKTSRLRANVSMRDKRDKRGIGSKHWRPREAMLAATPSVTR